jgi:hypothetical protein
MCIGYKGSELHDAAFFASILEIQGVRQQPRFMHQNLGGKHHSTSTIPEPGCHVIRERLGKLLQIPEFARV